MSLLFDSKDKFKNISEQLNIPLETLYDVFITDFIVNCRTNDSYRLMYEHLKKS